MNRLKQYLFNNLMALDILGNTSAGGTYKEPVSSRIGKNPHCSFIATGLYRLLNWLEPNHCEHSARNYPGVKKEDNVF